MTNSQEVSSPLRQMTFTQSPRPSGQNEGRFFNSHTTIFANQTQYLRRSTMTPAQAQTVAGSNRSSLTKFRATAPASSSDNHQ
jgi:hypothetical protein